MFTFKSTGIKVELFLSTNECVGAEGENWEGWLRSAYAPWLQELKLVECDWTRGFHCLMKAVYTSFDEHLRMLKTTVDERYDSVLITRPDLMILPKGVQMVRDLVASARDRITWPWRCEEEAWKNFACVVDTFVGVPSRFFRPYEKACLGHAGCHPEASLTKICLVFCCCNNDPFCLVIVVGRPSVRPLI